MNTQTNKHIPVMINQAVNFLPQKENLNIIDATFGGGGYSKLLLMNKNINNLIAIDRDPLAKIYAKKLENKTNFKFIEGQFSKIDQLVSEQMNKKNFKGFDAIFFDLGMSSNQIEDKKRGFSFQINSPLDMRMSQSGLTAEEFLNKSEKKNLTEALKNFGEERKASKIASAIIKNRPLKSTKDFAKIIYSVLGSPKKSETNPATRSFQAIRIAINDELNEIEKGLSSSLKLLKPGGRIIAVSFHSLEDRIVKNIFSSNSYSNNNVNRHLPETKDNHPIYLKSITKKPIIPNEEEFFQNPRSRSAKLRAAERTNIPWVGENRCSMGVF